MVNLVIALTSFEVHLSPNTTRCQKLASVVLTLGASTWVAVVCFNFEQLWASGGLNLFSVSQSQTHFGQMETTAFG